MEEIISIKENSKSAVIDIKTAFTIFIKFKQTYHKITDRTIALYRIAIIDIFNNNLATELTSQNITNAIKNYLTTTNNNLTTQNIKLRQLMCFLN